MKRLFLVLAVALAIGLANAQSASAAMNFSFTGMFTQDDDVQLFNFVVGATSNVTLRTWSYAGGVNAAGAVIARGGFDPILAMFNSTGGLEGQNDDDLTNTVAADNGPGGSGNAWDTYFQAINLAPGTYTVTIQQYNNFAAGLNLSDGFIREGDGNFTGGPFLDVSGSQRDSHWAFDILNVEQAVVVGDVPEPASLALWGLGALGCAIGAYRRKRA